MHDISDLEARGVPSVFVASREFVTAAEAQARALGFPAARVFVPHPIHGFGDRTLDQQQRDYILRLATADGLIYVDSYDRFSASDQVESLSIFPSELHPNAEAHRRHARPCSKRRGGLPSPSRSLVRSGKPGMKGGKCPLAWSARLRTPGLFEVRSKGQDTSARSLCRVDERWRRGAELNRCTRFCRPLPNHSATPPKMSAEPYDS